MAITLQELCKNASFLYGMRVLAGEQQLNCVVQWVHQLEDEETSSFLHGNELVFTTGIAHRGEDWLLPFVKKLKEREASGLVVNYGPYISEVPKDVIEYCSREGFPLLEVPWKTRLIDITRDFCNQIIQNDKKEENISSTLKNIIFYPGDMEKYIPILERNGFLIKETFCLVGIMATEENAGKMLENLRMQLERRLYFGDKRVGFFFHGKGLFLVFNGYSGDHVEKMVRQIQDLDKENGKRYHVAVGPFQSTLEALGKVYHRIIKLLHVMEKREGETVYYDRLGMKKLLLSIDEEEILINYQQEILGKLITYDKENDTNYLAMLRLYIDCDGSVQMVAEENFVHRNTVNYQLTKIKKILGMNLNNLEERLKLMLAFQITDLLD